MEKASVTDMTTGSPIKHILMFTLPLLIGNLFQQLYNMVDSIIVGRYVGKNALAAVGACGSMNFLFFSLSAGLAGGIGVIIAQYYGAKDEAGVRRAIANSYYILAGIALIVSIIGIIVSPALLRLLGTPESFIEDSITYMRITCSGIVGVSMYNGISSELRALGDSKTPLYFLIFASIVNVVLDLVFVLCCGMGVAGVALATIISQYLSALVAFIYAWKKIDYFRSTWQELKPDWLIVKKSFQLGVPLALQNSMIAVSCIVLQGVVNGFGEDVVAAYTITGRVEQLVQQPYGSIAMAITNFVGQNVGARKLDRVKKGFRQSVLVIFIFSMLLIPVMYLFGRQISIIFVDKSEAEVIEIAYNALKITSLCYFPLGMIYAPRALLNGCGDAAFAMINGLTEVAGRVVFSQVFVKLNLFGCWSIWITTACTWTITAIVCLIRYFRGRWKHVF